ncbi:hypothetical protein EVAR_2258_1 [Eumeta japonica]|uniref:Uncharacterized protein n=1 Tax=Eumeta variegata TaxID=151549 RepID=A0A4C1SIJ0_EUMVA|nr:hypothetical protein EVAR_2258_1 [Eumeta japonica]
MDVKCNDLTDQRDRLQVLVSEMDDCRNHYEQSLLQIQVLQEVHTCNINMDKLQHELDLCRVNETVRLCDSLLDSTARLDNRKQYFFYSSSSKKIKKFFKLNKFIRRSKKMIRQLNLSYKKINYKKQNIDLLKSINNYETKLFERDSECQSLQDQMSRLQNSLAELSARIEPRNFNYTLDIKLNSDMSDDGLDCTASNKKTEQSIALNNKNASIPESVTSALHTVINYENETVIYSDELGIGLGPMLSGYMNHRVTNICMPGMQNKELEIELFMSYANIDILCITEHWLRNYQLQFGFVNHQVASSFSRDQYVADP